MLLVLQKRRAHYAVNRIPLNSVREEVRRRQVGNASIYQRVVDDDGSIDRND